jgi:hypothetical protein
MKFKHLKKSVVVAAVAVSLFAVQATVSAITPGSIPYVGEETSGTNFPAFNIFNGVPSVGNEADFIRVKKDGEANSALRNAVDTTCKTGDRFDVWFYLHNGAKPSLNQNGTGPGVAKDVVAKLNWQPTDPGTSFTFTGGVTASNAQAISDTAVINCGGKQFRLNYVANSADAFLDLPNTIVKLPDSFITTGAPIGTNLLDGNVWGCWDQRIWMGLKVEVEEITPPPATAQCSLFQIVVVDGRLIRVSNFDYSVQNGAAIKNVTINWGDGSTETVNPGEVKGKEHTYAKDGTYNVTTKVTFTVPGKEDIVSEVAACAQQVQFAPGKPPVVTPPTTTAGVTQQRPTTLVNTGAGSIIGLFAAATIAGTIGYRRFLSRQLGIDS